MYGYYLSTCSRGDADETSDHALDCTYHRGLAKEEDVKDEPCEQAGGSADVGVEDSQRRIYASGVGVTAVEPRPARP